MRNKPGHVEVPPLRREWLIAGSVGFVIAMVGVCVVAYVESVRYPPAKTAEEEAHEWGTPRPAPVEDVSELEAVEQADSRKDSETDTETDSGDESDSVLDDDPEQMIDVEIRGDSEGVPVEEDWL